MKGSWTLTVRAPLKVHLITDRQNLSVGHILDSVFPLNDVKSRGDSLWAEHLMLQPYSVTECGCMQCKYSTQGTTFYFSMIKDPFTLRLQTQSILFCRLNCTVFCDVRQRVTACRVVYIHNLMILCVL